MNISTVEPKIFTAGNNVYWNKSISDYPASSYLLSYQLVPLSGGFSHKFDATPSGDTHQIRVSPAVSIAFTPGDYVLIGTVTDIATSGSTTKQAVSRDRIQVLPSPESTIDRRTFAESILDDLQATYKKLASNSIQSATVNGRTYTRNTLESLRAEITHYKNEIRNENGGATRRIAVTFNRPS